MTSASHVAEMLDAINEQLIARHDQTEATIGSLRAALATARQKEKTDSQPELKKEIAKLQHRLRIAGTMAGEQQACFHDALVTGAARALCAAVRTAGELLTLA